MSAWPELDDDEGLVCAATWYTYYDVDAMSTLFLETQEPPPK